MAATRLSTMSKPSGIGLSNENSSNLTITLMVSRPRTLMCQSKVGLSSSGGDRKPVAAKAAGVLVSEPKTDKGVELALLLACVAEKMSQWMKFITKERPWRFHIQMFVEKAIIDCRFFTLLATAGSLLGSVLCFVEGCFLILESYFQYFHSLSQMSEQGHVVLLLIEAIDMFLVGTTMLVFGMALHLMFVGQDNFKGKGLQHTIRNSNLQKLPPWIGMECAVQAKSKIGHAVIMILQVQVLEKFKSIPVTNGVDLACFALAIFMSSASIFLLSRIAVARGDARC
ncbi:hypothetical protein PHJA_002437400 [Phtheirospermum japonicum]|uniref:Uncharacterized protein n=1 Tax=Phtheirospermum japonicum TaxID=374723 RepID=A0A830D728_9LAMI|nr:hypothetical protein PHJA_002437400 [Phtheirospermum japonicum]